MCVWFQSLGVHKVPMDTKHFRAAVTDRPVCRICSATFYVVDLWPRLTEHGTFSKSDGAGM